MPTTPQPTAVIHPVVPGVSALTVLGRPACVPLERLRADAARLIPRGAGALAYVPGGNGSAVLGVLTDTLLVDDSVLSGLVGDWETRLRGTSRLCDPETALLDVQWQVNLLGRTVLTAEGDAAPAVPSTADQLRRRRAGLLASMSVNLGERLRAPLVGLAELLEISGGLDEGRADTSALDLQRSPGGDDVGDLEVPVRALVGAWAVDGSLDVLELSRSVRSDVQRARRVPDSALSRLLREAFPMLLDAPTGSARETRARRLAPALGLSGALDVPLHVAVVLAGDDRSAERLEALRGAVGGGVELRSAQAAATVDELRALGVWADAVVLVDGLLADAPGLAVEGRPLLVDLSRTDVLGLLTRSGRREDADALLGRTAARADRLLVSDDGQRDLVLGVLAGRGRVNDLVYDADPSLRDLVAVETGVAELTRFCERPCRAADRGNHPVAPGTAARVGDLAIALQYLREGGVRNVAEKAAGRIRRVAAERKAH